MIRIPFALIAALLLAAPALAEQDPPPAQPAAGEARVTAEAVSGSVEYATPAADGTLTWARLEPKASIPANSFIRTGFRSSVELKFPDGSTVVVNRATKVGIADLKTPAGQGKTKIGLKYGTIRAEVQKGQKEGDFQVATPAATLSVGGSIADIGYAIDTCMGVVVEDGGWRILRPCRSRVIRGDEWGDCHLTQSTLLKAYNRDSAMADPIGLDETDRRVDVIHGRGTIRVGLPGGETTPQGPPTPPNPPQPLPIVNP